MKKNKQAGHKKYLSHGMGVNSTAMMLMLWDKGEKFENVFVDHGGDYPFAYEYCEYLRKQGFEITVLKTFVEGCHTIEEYCQKYNYLPSFKHRWCTDKFKIRPMKKYFEKPCVCFIGIAFDEQKRVKNIRFDKNIENRYPLIEEEMDRGACIDIIKDYGLAVPNKTGCWLCPFMRKIEVRWLYLQHPDLYRRRKQLELDCIKEDFYLTNGVPIHKVAMEGIPDICRYLG